jgi:hypothetical protein
MFYTGEAEFKLVTGTIIDAYPYDERLIFHDFSVGTLGNQEMRRKYAPEL